MGVLVLLLSKADKVAPYRVVSSCTGTQRNETLTNCVTTPCMNVKTIGIPPCTGTPGQPPLQHCSTHIHYNKRPPTLQPLRQFSSSVILARNGVIASKSEIPTPCDGK